ncbi:hypothetical protein AAM22_gp15 [Pantoea phage vB_PagM_AAM22]|nr:hypothetical protein AAM22_gp15 [Pantoea phage vB_PagM_AAM22]
MTEEQKQALIEWLKEGIELREEHGFNGNLLASMRVALAALTVPEDWKQRAEAAEAKLAERNKRRNPDYFLNRIESSDNWGPEVELRIYESQLDASKSQDDHGGGIIELFTRHAPAADLAELVPDESGLADRHIAWLNTLQRPMFSDEDWEELTLYTWLAFRDSFRIYRAAILRNIEESK